QDGCNNFCTFCRIPFARGAPVSRALEDVLVQIRELDAKGFSEAVLTGINMGVYRHQGVGFAELFRKILENAGRMMIRVSSVEPQSLEDAFVDALSHRNATPHIHLPLQGGTDSLLERMNRLYTTNEFLALVERIKAAKPDFAISTDLISGFPGETEEEHVESLRFAEACGFMKIHVFPYSRRPLSKAYDFPNQVDEKTRQRRVVEWKTLSDRLHLEYAAKMEGKTQNFILETVLEGDSDSEQTFEGTSDYYLKGRVSIPKNLNYQRGQKVSAKLTSSNPMRFEIAF
ncbi:MAG: radical SAM protein, partial [Spirochaetia bacterium]|nr:radical SAM protein [Spirochaetia bacterium]